VHGRGSELDPPANHRIVKFCRSKTVTAIEIVKSLGWEAYNVQRITHRKLRFFAAPVFNASVYGDSVRIRSTVYLRKEFDDTL